MDTNTPETETTETSAKKFIRTFAADMKMLQYGKGVPSVVANSRIPVPPRVVLGKGVSQPPVPPYASVTAPPPPPPIVSEQVTPQPPQNTPPPSPLASSVMRQQNLKPKPKSEVPVIETYASDFSDRIKETKASTATLIASQQDAGEAPAAPTNKGNNTVTTIAVVVGVVLILLGSVGVYVVYNMSASSQKPVAVTPTQTTPIFVDSRQTISGSGSKLVDAMEQSVTDPLAINTIRLLTTSKSSATTSDSVFLDAQFGAPAVLLRNINVSGGMAGVVRTNNGQSPFFILSVDSYAASFSGMLDWEPTMTQTLGTLFPPYPVSATTTATTTPVQPQNQAGSFKDETIQNHDVRVYQDASGNSILLYGYWDPSTLIIARDPAAFSEILSRLKTTR